jgi:NAD(P)-dependent dehydrogenase (short-subunit alcohol dehydrogenase family)
MKLDGKVALVTGASQGIGRGIALALASEGADIVVNCDRNVEGAEQVAGEIRGLGRRAQVIRADVSQRTQVKAMISLALNSMAKLDILVNNAGLIAPAPMLELAEADWDRVMDVNLKGAFLCCQAVGQHMAQRRSGAIVNVASIAAHMPEVNAGAYTPSKAGVVALTRLLAIEWARYGVRVNALSPGPVMTDMQRSAYPTEELLAARNNAVPMNRHGTPQEIGQAAVFLASDDASYMTGAELHIDGGSLYSMYHLVHRLADRT